MQPAAERNDIPETLRISRDEAMSQRVDELLRRQMSLRGESAEPGRKASWHYRSWFVLMLAAMAAAFLAWAVMEPFVDDYLYFSGTITQVVTDPEIPEQMRDYLPDPGIISGWISIGDEGVWLYYGSAMLEEEGISEIDPGSLEVGQPVAAHIEYADSGLAIAHFLQPLAKAPAEASPSLAQLSYRGSLASFLLFPVLAGLIGLAIGSVDGLLCRRVRKGLFAGGVGLLVGMVGGLLSSMLGGILYLPFGSLSPDPNGTVPAIDLIFQMMGRGLAWSAVGLAMGLGQGIALQSRQLLAFGLLGGVAGGLIGGLLFDPIHLLLGGFESPSAHWSRLIGLLNVGACVGGMIGLVELMAREAWLRMLKGPLAGKEFLIFKNQMSIGSSPRSDIYLFNDPDVEERHAEIRAAGECCEIESLDAQQPVLVNNFPVTTRRLRNGDRIMIGETVLLFQERQG